MSVIDQAFIRAYQAADVALPGAALGSVAASRPAETSHPHAKQSTHESPPRPHFGGVGANRQAAGGAQGFPSDSASDVPYPGSPAAPAVATHAGSAARRPLSELVRSPQPVDAAFRPALEVDGFRYTPAVQRLTAQRQWWDQTLAVLRALAEEGRTVVGVGGCGSGVGCTTVAICIARLAAAEGRKTALADADFVTAGLARELGLSVELGWEDVLAGRVPLAEAAVQSLADGLTLLPLVAGGTPASEKVDGVHGSITAGVLRYHHDLVLVDLGSLAEGMQSGIARRVARQCRLDAVLLVEGGAGDRLDLAPELASVMLGTIQNRVFVGADAASRGPLPRRG